MEYVIVIALLAEGLVELEVVLLDVLCQIDLLSAITGCSLHLADNEAALGTGFDDVWVAACQFFSVQRPFSDGDLYFRWLPIHLKYKMLEASNKATRSNSNIS